MRSPIAVTSVQHSCFASGTGISDSIVTTSRFILILKGELLYTMEGNLFSLSEGAQFLVPAWCRRQWSTSPKGACELFWCEFDDDPKEIGSDSCFHRLLSPSALTQERKAYRQMIRLWQQRLNLPQEQQALRALELESQLKAMLGRFWPYARQMTAAATSPRELPHPDVRKAVHFIENNFTKPEALSLLHNEYRLTPNYFRQQFRDAMGCTPGHYVRRLRMRYARHLLHTTHWQHKRIAIECGYPDALYFSRVYSQFWGHSPATERREGMPSGNFPEAAQFLNPVRSSIPREG